MVRLEPITRDNYEKVAFLKVEPSQRDFVADNLFSLAQAAYERECTPLAITADGEYVGFCMYAMDKADKFYWIVRLMIDQNYQGRGYGESAMRQLIRSLRAFKGYGRIRISFEPENVRAKCLYEKLGFTNTGLMAEEELIYEMQFDESEDD